MALRIMCVRIVSLIVLMAFIMFGKDSNVYVYLLCVCKLLVGKLENERHGLV